ncbi:hypothetical protein LSH36_993g00036 [Paralvinella palmiformis]|uniref:Uncharacterized protein n=1 Tax=Paralvinella palmiformis TaxID=53620 RepID=A0AAD9MSF1_9ANNE|nr:hypothetical protein LSH36_993g00036 [Paralvinella palmiformis]
MLGNTFPKQREKSEKRSGSYISICSTSDMVKSLSGKADNCYVIFTFVMFEYCSAI